MAGLQDEVDVLRRIPLFANIEPARLKLLAFTSDRMAFAAGQELFHEGDAGDAAYVIIDGAVDVLKDTDEGEQLLVTLKKNAFVGDIAILCDVPRTATVKAVDRIETLKIQKEHFLRLIDRVSGNGRRSDPGAGPAAAEDHRRPYRMPRRARSREGQLMLAVPIACHG